MAVNALKLVYACHRRIFRYVGSTVVQYPNPQYISVFGALSFTPVSYEKLYPIGQMALWTAWKLKTRILRLLSEIEDLCFDKCT